MITKEYCFKISSYLVLSLYLAFHGVLTARDTRMFSDPKLERAVANQIGVPVNELSPNIVSEKLITFEFNDAKITSLKGLEHANNLRNLILRNNLIKDLSPISALPNLRRLDLSRNSLASLNSLLTNDPQNRSNKAGTNTPDSPVDSLLVQDTSTFRFLTDLNLANNNLRGLSGIGEFLNLRSLNVSYNYLVDLEGVSRLQKLKTLHLQGNQIGIQEPFEDLNKNKIFDATEPYKDISGNGKREGNPLVELKAMSSLRSLYLYDNHILSVDEFQRLPSLDVLLLSGNKLRNLSGLQNLKNLRKLHINNNSISDLNQLGELQNLTHLSLSENRICDVREISKLKNLRELHLQFNHISEIDSLKFLDNLEQLHLTANSVFDISSIEDLKNLNVINVSRNFLSPDGISRVMKTLSGRGKLQVFDSEQYDLIESQINLIDTLSSSYEMNEKFCSYLNLFGYERFSDFIISDDFTVSEKQELYARWDSLLSRGLDLSESGFKAPQ